MWYSLDENNQPYPVTTEEMIENSSFREKLVVKQETVILSDLNYRVSTVFLSLDHNWGDGLPVLWETMIFTNDLNLNQYQERYTSYADALARHNQICDSLRSGITESDRFAEGFKSNKNAFKNLFETIKKCKNE